MPSRHGIVWGVPATDPTTMLAALANPVRLRLLAKIAEAGRSGCRINELQVDGVGEKHLRGHLKRLLDAGLIDASDADLVARLDRMLQTQDASGGRRAFPGEGTEAGAYFRDGALLELPRADGMRRAVLAEIARRFEQGRTYSEADVNAVLREIHPDYSAIRRHMVEHGVLERDQRGTLYRRPPRDIAV